MKEQPNYLLSPSQSAVFDVQSQSDAVIPQAEPQQQREEEEEEWAEFESTPQPTNKVRYLLV